MRTDAGAAVDADGFLAELDAALVVLPPDAAAGVPAAGTATPAAGVAAAGVATVATLVAAVGVDAEATTPVNAGVWVVAAGVAAGVRLGGAGVITAAGAGASAG